MPTPIAVLTSDLHLDEYAWADRPDLAGDSQDAFEQIVDYAVAHKLPIIAAGDLIDKKRNDSAPIGFLRRMLDRLQAAECPFFYVQGQHELQPEPWVSEIHDWPLWLGERSSDDEPIPAYPLGPEGSETYVSGVDWQPRDKVAAELAKVQEGVHLLVMHQVMGELMGTICTPELTADMLPDVPMLLIGDYHKHVQLTKPNSFGRNTTILSPGSTNMREISETPQKAFYVLYDDLTYESVPLSTRTFIYKELNFDEAVDEFVATIGTELNNLRGRDLCAGLRKELTKPLLRVGYDPSLSNVYSRVKNAVGDLAHLFFRELPQKQFDDEEDEEAEEVIEFREAFQARGLVGLLPRVIDPECHDMAYMIAERLLESDEPAQTLQTIRAEFFDDSPLLPIPGGDRVSEEVG